MIDKINNLQKEVSVNMKKCVDTFKCNLNKIHAGRASSGMMYAIVVEYHGSYIPLSKLANIVVEDSKTLALTVFDINTVRAVEKAIATSDLELTPFVHGNIIRIKLPLLTEDRRKKLIKMVRTEAERSKISVRNMRRIANDKIKIFIKHKDIDEDTEHYFQNEIQKLTDFWIKEIDSLLKNKELELIKF